MQFFAPSLEHRGSAPPQWPARQYRQYFLLSEPVHKQWGGMPGSLSSMMQIVEAYRPETLRSVHVLAEHQFSDAKRVQSKRCPPAPRRPGRSWPHGRQICCIVTRLEPCLMALRRSTSGCILHCLLRLDDLTATAASVICRARPPCKSLHAFTPTQVSSTTSFNIYHPIGCELTRLLRGLTSLFRDSRGAVILATMRPK